MSPNAPELVFLGIAERAANQRDGNTDLLKWNILGLKSIVLFYFFPAIVNNINLVFALRALGSESEIRIKIKSDTGDQLAFLNISLYREVAPDPPWSGDRRSLLVRQLDDVWTPIVFQFAAPKPMAILRPSRCSIFQELSDGSERNVGAFYCGTTEPEPLTLERIAAIRSDPRAAKAVRFHFSCNDCNERIGAYAALEQSTSMETEGFTWYQDLPDSFRCSCGKNEFDLRGIRKNLFGLIGINQGQIDEDVTYVPLYERSTLNNLRTEFIYVLNATPKEEVLQKFIEGNPILLRQFPAQRILFKPPLLTRYVADFAVLSPQRELILIEIEPPDITLLRRNGDHAAPLTHAVNQVQNWLQVIDDHRVSCLTEMKIEPSSVGNIRGVVIGGRDGRYDPSHLRQLKGVFSGRISVLTYDDLLGSLTTLIDQMDHL